MLPRRAFALTSAAVLAITPLPLLTLLPGTFVGHLDYAFAPFALIAAIFLARLRLRQSHNRWHGKRWIGRSILTAAGLTLFIAAIFGSPWGAAMSLILMAAAFAWDEGGRPALRAVFPSLLLLAICIPLPLDLDRTLVATMSRWSARWASDFLDLLSVAHIRAGQFIVFDGGRADLAALLGGPISPFACAAALLIFAQVFRRNWWRTLIIIAIGLAFLPVVMATLAAVRTAWVGAGPDFLWAAVGAVLAILLAFSFDQWVGIPVALALKPHVELAVIVLTTPAGPVIGDGAFGVATAAAFVCLALFQAWGIAARAAVPIPAPIPSFPSRIGDWIADRPSDTNDGVTRVIYRNGDRKMELAIVPATSNGGVPLADLEAAGWLVQTPAVSDTDPSLMQAKLELPAETFAAVCLCGLTAHGQRLAQSIPLSGAAGRARAALARPFGDKEATAVWWVRITSVTLLPPTRREMDEPAEILRHACEELATRMCAGVGS